MMLKYSKNPEKFRGQSHSCSVSAGLNKMEWIYRKDISVSDGSDCAWIDMIDFGSVKSCRYIQRDLSGCQGNLFRSIMNKYGLENITVKVLNVGKDTLNGFTWPNKINDYLSPIVQYFDNKVIPYGDSVTVSFKAMG